MNHIKNSDIEINKNHILYKTLDQIDELTHTPGTGLYELHQSFLKCLKNYHESLTNTSCINNSINRNNNS